jgi:hypothetical protein
MKTWMLLLLTLFAGFTAKADGLPGIPAGMSPSAYHDEQWRKWMGFSKNFQTVADVPLYISQAKTEKEFLTELPALEKTVFPQFPGGAMGWMSQHFVDAAYNTFQACSIDKSLQKEFPKQWDVFNKNFYYIHIVSVSFNLCQDGDSSDCSFETSFAAKNYPDRKLILVNAYRWNMMKDDERKTLAVHEFLGVIGVEEGTYDFSADSQLKEVITGTATGYNQKSYCVHRRGK